MTYFFNKTIPSSFEETLEKVTNALKEEGFGVLTEIDVKETLKKKLDVDTKKYKILGACNPHFAWKAIQMEDKIGLMLPCNVLVEESGDQTEVSVIDPVVSMQGVQNDNLKETAAEVRNKLKNVLESL